MKVEELKEYVKERVDSIHDRMDELKDDLSGRLDKLENEESEVEGRMTEHEKLCENRHGVIDTRFDNIDEGLKRSDRKQNLTLGILGSGIALLIGYLIYLNTGVWPGA